MARILIAGCGDLGGRLGLRLVTAGHRVWGMRRRVGRLPAGLVPLAADLTNAESVATHLPRELDSVVWCAAAPRFDDDSYRRTHVGGLGHLLAALQHREEPPRRMVVVSSTSVYGQTGGDPVDEESPTEPERFPGLRLLESRRWPTTLRGRRWSCASGGSTDRGGSGAWRRSAAAPAGSASRPPALAG